MIVAKNWKEYEIQYKYKSSLYKIKVKNNKNKNKNTGVERFILNGENVPEKEVILQDNCKIYNIEIFM